MDWNLEASRVSVGYDKILGLRPKRADGVSAPGIFNYLPLLAMVN
jgi:hypothetical protein